MWLKNLATFPTRIAGLLALMAAALLLDCHALLAQTAAKIDFGEPAPQWLRDSESYGFAYSGSDWEALAESKVKFITHCPVNRDFFARCHALGIRCFPYVTFYQGCATETYQGVNLKDHPELIEVDAQGNLMRTGFWESEDAKNMYTTCPNVSAYQNAMVAWVERDHGTRGRTASLSTTSARGRRASARSSASTSTFMTTRITPMPCS